MSARQKGLALVSVLWVLTLLSLVAAGVSASIRDELRLAGNLVALAQARNAAQGGVQLALHGLLASKGQGAELQELTLGDATVRVSVADEAGKIDLNAAREDLLDGLLRSAGVADEVRHRLLEAILDWRDADSFPRPQGAEDPQYLAAGKAYGAKDGPFESVDELQLVLGMTHELYRTLKPALTVHSRQAGMQAASASRTVLMAIPTASAEEVDRYIELRERNREAAAAAPPPPLTWQPYLVRMRGAAFSVHAQARHANGVSAHITATVALRRAAAEDAPFAILDWRDEGPELFSP